MILDETRVGRQLKSTGPCSRNVDIPYHDMSQLSSENSFKSYYTNFINSNSKELDFDVESSDKGTQSVSVTKHTSTT